MVAVVLFDDVADKLVMDSGIDLVVALAVIADDAPYESMAISVTVYTCPHDSPVIE